MKLQTGDLILEPMQAVATLASHNGTVGVTDQDVANLLTDTESVEYLINNRFTYQMINDNRIAAAWNFVKQWYDKNEAAPSVDVLQEEYKNLKFYEPTKPVADVYYLLENRFSRNERQALIKKLADAHEDPERFSQLLEGFEAPRTAASKPAVWYQGSPELHNLSSEPIPWIAWPFIADGYLCSCQGLQKYGKTTYLLALAEAVVHGDTFLNHPTMKMPVTYLTEQGKVSFVKQCPERLIMNSDFYFLSFIENHGMSWAEFVTAGINKCEEVGSKLLIIDTANKFAQLEGDTNNSDGHVRKALAELSRAQSEGVNVILSKHNRKAEGRVEVSAGGAGAWAQEPDIIVDIRMSKGLEKHQRTMEVIGRIEDANGEYIVQYDSEEKKVSLMGEIGEVKESESLKTLKEVLADGEELSVKELTLATGLPQSTVSMTLKRHEDVFIKVRKGVYQLEQ